MRDPSATDFFVELPGVGTFRYGRRNFGDRLAIRRDCLRLTQEFGDTDEDLSVYATLIATHGVLCVEAPEGWDNLALLPDDDDSALEKALTLGILVREKEESFRKGADKSGQDEGPGAGAVGGVPVSETVRSDADGPPVPVDDRGGHAG